MARINGTAPPAAPAALPADAAFATAEVAAAPAGKVAKSDEKTARIPAQGGRIDANRSCFRAAAANPDGRARVDRPPGQFGRHLGRKHADHEEVAASRRRRAGQAGGHGLRPGPAGSAAATAPRLLCRTRRETPAHGAAGAAAPGEAGVALEAFHSGCAERGAHGCHRHASADRRSIASGENLNRPFRWRRERPPVGGVRVSGLRRNPKSGRAQFAS